MVPQNRFIPLGPLMRGGFYATEGDCSTVAAAASCIT